MVQPGSRLRVTLALVEFDCGSAEILVAPSPDRRRDRGVYTSRRSHAISSSQAVVHLVARALSFSVCDIRPHHTDCESSLCQFRTLTAPQVDELPVYLISASCTAAAILS